MSTKAAYEMMSELDSSQYYFIDIRNSADFNNSHPLGSKNYCSNEVLLNEFINKFEKNSHIFIICYKGNTSLLTQRELKNHGFKNVHSIDGGYSQWEREFLPIEYNTENIRLIEEMNLYCLSDGFSETPPPPSTNSQLETIGFMTASAFHEISSPLMVLDSSVRKSVKMMESVVFDSDAQKKIEILPELHKKILDISKAVSRIESIVSVMKNMSYNSQLEEKQTVIAERFITEMTTIARMITGHQILWKISKKLKGQNILIYKNQLIQILANLIKNSADEIEKFSDKWIEINMFSANNNLYFNVIDSGNGIPLEIQENIMKPLFTTKPIGKGTGLGLKIVRDICKANGGEVYLDRANKNTSFVFYIRLAA